MAGFLEGRQRAIEMLKKGVIMNKMTKVSGKKNPYKRIVFLSPSLDRILWAEAKEDIRGFVMCCDVRSIIPTPDDPKALIIQSSDEPLELQVIPPDTRDHFLTIFRNVCGK